MSEALVARVRAVVEPVVVGDGAILESVEVRPIGRRKLVRILVDTATGIGLDEVAQVSRTVSSVLDETNVMGEKPYVLEVSSPGVERPLTLPRHWRRNVGRLVRITRRTGGDPVIGRIAAVDDVTVMISVPGSDPGDPQTPVALADVGKAVVQVEIGGR